MAFHPALVPNRFSYRTPKPLLPGMVSCSMDLPALRVWSFCGVSSSKIEVLLKQDIVNGPKEFFLIAAKSPVVNQAVLHFF